jgi:voltage-gated potassium channel
MLIGYGIIAVPTSIVTVELSRTSGPVAARRMCPRCGLAEHAVEARYCLRCGEALFGPMGPAGTGCRGAR